MALTAARWRLILRPFDGASDGSNDTDVTARVISGDVSSGSRIANPPLTLPYCGGSITLDNTDNAFTPHLSPLFADSQIANPFAARLEVEHEGNWQTWWGAFLEADTTRPRRGSITLHAASQATTSLSDTLEATLSAPAGTQALIAALDALQASDNAREPSQRFPRIAIEAGSYDHPWAWPQGDEAPPLARQRGEWLALAAQLAPSICWQDTDGKVWLRTMDRFASVATTELAGDIADKTERQQHAIAPSSYHDVSITSARAPNEWPTHELPAALDAAQTKAALAWWQLDGFDIAITQPVVDGLAFVAAGASISATINGERHKQLIVLAPAYRIEGRLLMRTLHCVSGAKPTVHPFVLGVSTLGGTDTLSPRGTVPRARQPFNAAAVRKGDYWHLVLTDDTTLTLQRALSAQVILIGGGGGPGITRTTDALAAPGGGGAGGILAQAVSIPDAATLTIAVGDGGPVGRNDGGDTTASFGTETLTAFGGGGGGNNTSSSTPQTANGRDGRPATTSQGAAGSGGGAGSRGTAATGNATGGAPGKATGGHRGGGARARNGTAGVYASAGGGGALSAGTSADHDGTRSVAGQGGAGWQADLTFEGEAEYAKGGDGQTANSNVIHPDADSAGSGGTQGGNGADGLAVIRWRDDGATMQAADLLTVS